MGSFLTDNIVNIVFGITTLISSALALHYKRLEHQREVEEIIDEGRKAGLFLSREAMIKYLLHMYDEAEAGDIIWAQCVRCTDFTPEVRKKILEAAGRGVRFQMAVNMHSPATEEFRTLFEPIEGAEIFEAPDNTISLQGLSDREVVIAFPAVESYTAVLARDKNLTRIMRSWFDYRFGIRECANYKDQQYDARLEKER
jgi:hypothetical protein